jgi:hypothetical protein
VTETIRQLQTNSTVSVPTAAAAFGIGRSEAYGKAKRGHLPFPIIKIGRRLVVPTRPVLDLLGLNDTEAGSHQDPATAIDVSPDLTKGLKLNDDDT